MTSIPKSSEICVAVISPETTVTSVLTPKAEPPKHRISFRFRYLPLGGFFQNTLIFAGRVWKNSFRENLGFCSGGYLQIVVHSSSGRVLYSISPPFRSLYYSAPASQKRKGIPTDDDDHFPCRRRKKQRKMRLNLFSLRAPFR